MKLLIFIVTITLISCSSYPTGIDPKIEKFVDEIIHNPSKLDNIYHYYPEFYDSSLTRQSPFNTTEIYKDIGWYLWKSFVIENESYDFQKINYTKVYGYELNYYQKLVNYKLTSIDELYGLHMIEPYHFYFEFIKKGDKFIFVHLGDNPYLDYHDYKKPKD